MATLQDAILAATGGPTVNDGLRSWYIQYGGGISPTASFNDLERRFLKTQMPASDKTTNADLWRDYLSGLGYTGTLNDMMLQYWLAQGGTPPAWDPSALFAANEQGVWYDPSDLTTMWQDTAGTTPVTADGQTVARIDDKSGNGKHATQANAASRPVLGVHPVTGLRNLLTYTEDFSNASWVKSNATVTSNAAVAPDGTTTADKLVESSDASLQGHRAYSSTSEPVVSGAALTTTCYVKAGERPHVAIYPYNTASGAKFNLTTGTVQSANAGVTASITSVGSGWYRCSASITAPGTAATPSVYALNAAFDTTYIGDGTSGIYLWGAQLEAGSTATAYQKVVAATNVTEAGVDSAYYLKFDGTDDFLVTSAIDFSATDEMSVFAGMRKSSDAARGALFTHNGTNTNAFSVEAPTPALNNMHLSAGGNTTARTAAYLVAAPTTQAISGLIDLSAPYVTLRTNGVQRATNTGGFGGGNFANAALYLGRRDGADVPLNGNIYSFIARGKTSSAAEIAATEAWVNSKTGAY